MRPTVFLQPKKQGNIRRGHPWIFPKAILREKGKLITGELVDIFSAENEPIGVGVYNEHSLYRIRVLALAFEGINTDSIVDIVKHRFKQALEVRRRIDLPNQDTTAFRVVNSEADGLSGITIDRFNNTYVVSSTAYWVQAHQNELMICIKEVFQAENILWLAQAKPLAQDGWQDTNSQELSGSEIVLEAGVKYAVDFSNTQKTGLFLDQRENHQRIAALAKGKHVLDLYTYTGGFALHAAKGGALSVTAVDSSEQAIRLAEQNARLNELDSIQFIAADARDYLSQAENYDLVILDPPKLVPSQRHIERAKNYYRFLHREVFKSLKSGSLLLTCNCSSALPTLEFNELVSAQAMTIGKMVRILGVYGPASCHPTLAAFPEGNYLTATLLAVV